MNATKIKRQLFLFSLCMVSAGFADDVTRIYFGLGKWDNLNWTESNPAASPWRMMEPQDDGSIKTNRAVWADGELAVFPTSANCSLGADVYCAGIERGGGGYVGGSGNTGSLSIGGEGVTFTGSVAFNGWFGSNMGFTLTDSQTWCSVEGKKGTFNAGYTGSGLSYVGTPTFSSAEDVVWTLSNVSVNFNASGLLTNCDVVVGMDATLTVGANASFEGSCLNARSLTVDGGTVSVLRNWAPTGERNLSANLKIANGGKLTFTSPGVCDIDSLEISAGTVTIDYALPLVKDIPLVVDSGATLVLKTAPTGGKFISLSGDGTVNLTGAVSVGDLSGFTGHLKVSKGVVALPIMSKWPDGFSVETDGDGMVYVPTRVDFDAMKIGGTGNYVNNPNAPRKTLRMSSDGSGSYWNGTAAYRTVWIYRPEDTNIRVEWLDDSVATNQYNVNVCADHYVYQFYRIGAGFFGNQDVDYVFHLGAGGLVMDSGASFDGRLGGRNTLDLSDSQTWTTPSGSSTINIGSASYATHGVPKVTAAPNTALTVTGNTALNFNAQGALEETDVTIVSPARLTVSAHAAFTGYLNGNILKIDGATVTSCVGGWVPEGAVALGRSLEFVNGGTLSVEGAADFGFESVTVESGDAKIAGAGSAPISRDVAVVVKSGASLSIEALLPSETAVGGSVYGLSSVVGAGSLTLKTPLRIKSLKEFSGSLTVESGVAQLPAMSDWPEGLSVATEVGAFIRLDSMQGYDASRITGSGSLVPVIEDAPYAASELVLNAGEYAIVKGSGLKAGTTVVLNGGELLFERTATVSSSINVTGAKSVLRTAAESITGTLLGAVTIEGGSHWVQEEQVSLCLYGQGTNVIAGGLTAKYGGDQLWVCEGTAVVSNRQVRLGTAMSGSVPQCGTKSGLRENAKRLIVCNGGAIVLPRPVYLSDFWISGVNSPVLEVVDGGKVQFNTSTSVHLGKNGESGMILISGGEFCMYGFAGGDFCIAEAAGKGAVVIRSGTLALSRPIVHSGEGELVFDGGTLSLYGEGDQYDSWGRNFRYIVNGPTVRVTENGGTLDMSGCRSVVSVVTNQLDRAAASAWQGPGILKVVGPTDRDIAFCMNESMDEDGAAVATTLGLAFQDIPNVTFAKVDLGAVRLDKLDLMDDRLVQLLVEDESGFALGSVRVRSGLAWDKTIFRTSALSVGSLILDSGACLTIDAAPSGAVDALVLSGTLNLPDVARFFVRAPEGTKVPVGSMAVTAANGVVCSSETVWKRVRGSAPGVRPTLSADGNSLILDKGPGLMLIVR